MTSLSRRALLRRSAIAAAAATAVPAPISAQPRQAAAGSDWVRVYLVVIDGLRPDEVGQMPTLTELASEGWFYPSSRAQMVAETTPNHVSMITGMRADRHGMPANDVPFVDDNIGVNPRYLQTDTIYSLIARQSPDLVATAATAKEYIVQMSKHERVDPGTEDADATNDPFIVPVSGSAIDAEVGPDALAQSREQDPDFAWMSLGDVDRVGHVDETGATGGPPVARTVSLQTADSHVANLVNELKDSGRWENTVMLVTADHSMDWSRPDSIVSLTGTFEDEPTLAGQTAAAQNGGVALYTLLAPDAPGAKARLKSMRDIALGTEGVLEAWYIRPNPEDGGIQHWVGTTRPDWGLTGDHTGDLVVVTKQGFRVTEPSMESNPIPGNHGHIATLPIPQIVAGGWSGLNANDATPATAPDDVEPDVRLAAQGQNIDMAPTIAWLLGLAGPPGGFDGRILSEAFARRPDPRVGVASVLNVPRFSTVAGQDRAVTAVALSRRATPEALDADGAPVTNTVVLASGDTFPDALAATPLAAARNAPLLLTSQSVLNPAVAAEIDRLQPETILLIGGESALSAAVESQVAEAMPDAEVRRIAGDSRYATAAAVAMEIVAADGLPGTRQGGEGADVILASGQSFPDALAAGPLAAISGRVILLTRPDDLPQETADALAALNPARITIAGGPAAVGESVEAALRGQTTVERLGGESRQETAVALIERTIREGGLTDLAFCVNGDTFADALAAGVAAARLGGMLLPFATAGLAGSRPVARLLEDRAAGLVEVIFVGGDTALSPTLRDDIQDVVTSARN